MSEKEKEKMKTMEQIGLKPEHSGGVIHLTFNDPEVIRHLADMAADCFEKMIEAVDPDIVSTVVRSLDEAEEDEFFEGLKMLFDISGNKVMASAMDIVRICDKGNSHAVAKFKDSFLSTDILDICLMNAWYDFVFGEEDDECPTVKQ